MSPQNRSRTAATAILVVLAVVAGCSFRSTPATPATPEALMSTIPEPSPAPAMPSPTPSPTAAPTPNSPPVPVATPVGRAAVPSDFNGDGFADLAIGVPGEAVASTNCGAGAVNVLYGSADGLTAAGDQHWTQHTPGVAGTAEGGDRSCDEWGDRFGWALASGDFDGDGHADLAIGVPDDGDGGIGETGSVSVLYGSARGLTASGGQRLSPANLSGAGAGDGFGASLESADFDGDGDWDLAVGAGERYPGVGAVGTVVVYHGHADGLTTSGPAVLRRSMTGADEFEGQGFAVLAAGELNGDSYADLAVGSPDHRCASPDCQTTGGDVSVFYGSRDGLSAAGAQRWSQASPGIADQPESDDQFGSAGAIGDFDDDGIGDLAIGAPAEQVSACPPPLEDCQQGVVHVLYGTRAGLTADRSQRWSHEVPSMELEADDFRFGSALAAGDFDADGADDMAVGIAWPGLAALTSGALLILHGGAGGLTAAGSQRWTEDSPGVPSSSEDYDEFGSSLAAADFGGSPGDDLAVGAPGEQVGRVWRAGLTIVLYGSMSGLSGTGAEGWGQDTTGVRGTSERYDSFGSSLAP